MTVRVDAFQYPAQTLEPGQQVAIGYARGAKGGPFYKMSASPDNYPASIELIQEWAFTDAQQEVWLAVRYRNNGANTVVFRAKELQAPLEFVVGPG